MNNPAHKSLILRITDDCITISKAQPAMQIIFGWGSVSMKANGTGWDLVEDTQGHRIAPIELEKMAYNYMLKSREVSDSHEEVGIGRVVEAVVTTPEKQKIWGVPPGLMDVGLWVGMKIFKREVWDRYLAGEFEMMSIGGRAKLIPAEETA